jgi:cytochrome oxidase Cu insertion factor (SCO1/SenC/PrrC family)
MESDAVVMFRDLQSFVWGSAVAVALWSSSTTIHADRLPAGLAGVGIQQRLNESLPLNLAFRDEHGRAVRLGDYFGRVPVVMTFNYFDCPMLCPLELNDVVRAMRAVSPDAGKDFLVLSVSIDPHDTSAQAAEKQQWNFVVLRAVRAAGVMTVLGLAAFMAMLMQRERRRSSHHAE